MRVPGRAVLAFVLCGGCLLRGQSSPEVAEPSAALRPPAHAAAPDALPTPEVTDAERSAVVVAALDIDLHLTPAAAREEAHVLVTVRNASGAPVRRIPLQISGALRWEAIRLGDQAVAWTQSPIGTDADHTRYAQEAVVTLPTPLAAGASLRLSVLYSGEIVASAARLTDLGISATDAAVREWDAIVPTTDIGASSLRGFGHVLWYPVAAPVSVLGEGNQLFAAAEAQRAANLVATLGLRLTVEYRGDPPEAVIFNGRLQPLTRCPDTADETVEETEGIATAEFAAGPLGFRVPSLFLTAQRSHSTPGELLAVISPAPELADVFADAGEQVAGLLRPWFGPTPLGSLTLLDHAGEPYEDGAFVARPLTPSPAKPEAAQALVRPLTHAFFAAKGRANLWLDTGMPEFMALLWIERTAGREAALASLRETTVALALREPEGAAAVSKRGPAAGEPLTEASSELYLRVKAAAVLWQLRELAGPETLQAAFIALRRTFALTSGNDPEALERSLARVASVAAPTAAPRDLHAFFHDWVYTDAGLPDLTIVGANPRPLPAKAGKSAGFLVAVEVQNDGGALADVPVTVRAGPLHATERLRIAPRSTASTRILFETRPELIEVNDGSVPELRTSTHSFRIRAESNAP